eukprot:8448399-Ditylum_brightwellii.AAC.1
MGVTEKDILSQYEFRRLLTLSYLDPDAHWPLRSSRTTINETDSNIQGTGCRVRVGQKSRNVDEARSTRYGRIKDKSVQLIGSFGCRLNHTTFTHLPLAA